MTSGELTARQKSIVIAILEYIEEFGYPPSVRDIGKMVGLSSPSSVSYQLKQLEGKGMIRRNERRPRSYLVSSAVQEAGIFEDVPHRGEKDAQFSASLLKSRLSLPRDLGSTKGNNVRLRLLLRRLTESGEFFVTQVRRNQNNSSMKAFAGEFLIFHRSQSANPGDIVAISGGNGVVIGELAFGEEVPRLILEDGASRELGEAHIAGKALASLRLL
ncbi:LexA family protein [Streptomyces sp. NPDC056534]|uniref:LexA family protein n=1 Tax=Streptomyces sp. NPDC056534 TaxID=3345857 RepID=UPI0036B276A4